ncbi:hypothetical protein [Nitrospina watsonii]|uniref:Uncharacterized protein n=1 Tax=Nitrospina watsonii TaxID=1323948 RepID=A0ABM9HE90_9BACT|nr:hypothetical protein [Nitrospina watsonii]CAI2718370.1 protein of unknown function [Nitrospina watsonii]
MVVVLVIAIQRAGRSLFLATELLGRIVPRGTHTGFKGLLALVQTGLKALKQEVAMQSAGMGSHGFDVQGIINHPIQSGVDGRLIFFGVWSDGWSGKSEIECDKNEA